MPLEVSEMTPREKYVRVMAYFNTPLHPPRPFGARTSLYEQMYPIIDPMTGKFTVSVEAWKICLDRHHEAMLRALDNPDEFLIEMAECERILSQPMPLIEVPK